jgi:hypothetical protein
MKYIVLFVIIIIIIVLLSKRNGSSATIENDENNPEFYRHYNSVNQMNYDELEKMHDALLPLCIRSDISGLVWYDDSIPYEQKVATKNRMDKEIGDIIPANERIYGCTTYADAKKLNQAVLKRMDQLDRG